MKITHDSTTFRSNFDCTNFTNVTTSNQTSIWQSSTTRNIANKNDDEEEMDESDSDDNEINLERTMPPPPAPLADISQLNDTNIILTIPGAYNSSMMQSYNFNNQSNFSDKNIIIRNQLCEKFIDFLFQLMCIEIELLPIFPRRILFENNCT